MLEYKFEIGDEVITSYGETGKVIDICECEQCAERGFYELIVRYDGYTDWITIGEAKNGFENYYQIGKYIFGNKCLNKLEYDIKCLEEKLAKCRMQKNVLLDLTGGENK